MNNQKKKISIGILLLLSLFILPLSSAVYYEANVTFNAPDSNITITTDIPIFIDEATVTNDTISLTNFTWTTGSLTLFWEYNIYLTFDGDEDTDVSLSLLPQSYQETENNYDLSSSVDAANIKMNFSVDDCDNVATVVYTSADGQFVNNSLGSDVCTNEIITLYGNFNVSTSTSYNHILLNSDFENSEMSGYCRILSDGFGSFGEYLALIILAFVFSIVFTLIYKQEFMKMVIVGGVIVIVFTAIMTIIGTLIVRAIC